MRTEEFERGYDSLRGCIQGLIGSNIELRKNEDLMHLAQYPYYIEEGIDWHPDCDGCKHRILDEWGEYICYMNVNFQDLGYKCDKREEED